SFCHEERIAFMQPPELQAGNSLISIVLKPETLPVAACNFWIPRGCPAEAARATFPASPGNEGSNLQSCSLVVNGLCGAFHLHMSTPPVENVVIIGTGCAGLTAAIYTGRANLNPLVLEGSLPGGQLTTTSEVENFPGFPEGIDGFMLMDNLRKQAQRFGARFEQALVSEADFTTTPYTLQCGDRAIRAHSVIIATGASPRMTGIPGERELFGGKGVTTCATC